MGSDFENVLAKVRGNDDIGYVFIQRTYDSDDATIDYTVFNYRKELYDGGQLEIDFSSPEDAVRQVMEGYGCESVEVTDKDVDDLDSLGFTGI